MIWCCPSCHGQLHEHNDHLECEKCATRYAMLGEIPDLRLPGLSWIDYETDRKEAQQLLDRSKDLSLEQMIYSVYSSRSEFSQKQINLRTQQVLQGTNKRKKDISGWLKPCLKETGLFMDLGCGPGYLISAAGNSPGIGIDVSLVWLVVAHRMIREYGGTPLLAAALAEHLPLPDHCLTGIISLDVIEHVNDPKHYLREINRVAAPGCHIALTTPNRYSLTAEPHVFVWGVGWLPRSIQKQYVKWRSGKRYEFTKLLSSFEIKTLLKENTDFDFRVEPGIVSEEEMIYFQPLKAKLAHWYNKLRTFALLRLVFLLIGPFFHIIGRK